MSDRHCQICGTSTTLWWKKQEDGFLCNPCYKKRWYLNNRGPLKRILLTEEQRLTAKRQARLKYSKLNKDKKLAYQNAHKAEKSAYDKAYRDRNKERLQTLQSKYRNTQEAKLHKQLYDRQYLARNREKINERSREAKRQSVSVKIKANLRSRTSAIVKRLTGHQKKYSTTTFLGCSIEELKIYLESKFQADMSWDNYGRHGWHIDHVTPLSAFDLTNAEQFQSAVHYTNLQPLWAIDNLKKGGKIGEV